jgi:hypothetical protein
LMQVEDEEHAVARAAPSSFFLRTRRRQISLLEQRMRTEEKDPVDLVSTYGRLFSNRSAIELVRDRSGNLKLLTWDGKNANVVDQFKDGDTTFTTPQLHPSVTAHLALPSGVADFGSARKLVGEISRLISWACGGNENVSIPLSFFVIASWLAEFAPVAPFLLIIVPPTCSAAAPKQVLQLLCRHAFVVNSLATSWPGSIPMALRPTLIAEVDSPSRSMLSLLRASQTHGVSTSRSGHLVDLFCAKAIFSREPLEDPASVGFPLEIILPAASAYAPPLDFTHAAQVADKFQNLLLGYRLANFPKIGPPTFELGTFSAPAEAMAHALAGSIAGDDDLQAQIAPFLQELDVDVRIDTSMMIKAAILESVVSHWGESEVGVTEITADSNTLIEGRGGSTKLTPEQLGWMLRGLGIRTVKISQGLKGLKMIDARPAIRKIATVYGVRVPMDPPCEGRFQSKPASPPRRR